jgi:transposase
MRRADEPSDYREGRRRRAWELKQQGWTQRAIAQALGVTEGAVSQWMKRVAEGGEDALTRHPPPGAAPRLSEAHRKQLPNSCPKAPKPTAFSVMCGRNGACNR